MGLIDDLLVDEGCAIIGASSSKVTGKRKLIGHPSLLGDAGKVKEALGFIPNEYCYDEWIRMCAAIKAALGGRMEHYEIYEEWCMQYPNDPSIVKDKWDSITETEIGASYIYAIAREYGFDDAADSFSGAGSNNRTADAIQLARDAMFERYLWCEELQRFIDTQTGHILTRDALNLREAVAGNPTSSKTCASMVYMRDMHRRQVVWGLTYRPGEGRFYDEASKGLCYNVYQPSKITLPEKVEDNDIGPWMQLVEHVLPDAEARKIILDWCAHTIQCPEVKCNWAPLVGSTAQGIGKDMMFQPLIAGVGEHNVSYVGPDDLASGYTDWAADAKLILVEEMMAFHRKEMMNRLKAFIAAPPDYIRVNKKFVPQYNIPNVASYLFFTNIPNALSLERDDRRFYVYWSLAKPREQSFYSELAEWYENDGLAKVVRWLMQRDITAFEPKGHAPWSKDKEEMRRVGQDPVAQWIEDCIEHCEYPFNTDLVDVKEVVSSMPHGLHKLKPTPQRVGHLIKQCKGISLGRIPFGQKLPHTNEYRGHLYAVRDVEKYCGITEAELAAIFKGQKAELMLQKFMDG